MGTAQRKPNPALIEELLRAPGTFEFFRAVQILEAHLAGRKRRRKPREVGHDHSPAEVGVRFDAAPSLAFPSQQIAGVETTGEGDGGDPRFDLRVSFLGLVGAAGTLPTHYTEFVLQRVHAKDTSLRDFLALFQDREAAFFYRAWKKYRVPAAFHAAAGGDPDPILAALLALVGLLPRPRGEALDAVHMAQVHHAGLFSNRRRSANGLRAMLRGLLGCDVEVEQFVGQWIELDPEARSRLGSGPGPGLPARLGDESVLGSRVWSVDSRVRVVAGPLDRRRFRELWPGGEPVAFLRGVLRAYLGPLIECDLVWELAPDAPATLQLGGDQQLGRDCWLGWSDQGGPDLRVASPPWNKSSPSAAGSRRVSA